MTGLMPISDLCSIAGCETLASFQICAKVWADSDPEHQRQHFPIETALAVCQAHRDAPLHTAPEFFNEDMRHLLTVRMFAAARIAPDFNSAEWDFRPLPVGAQS